ncbi:hypothetical protein C882_0978 [Caenispirillum salinarum AK4]|uniref:Phage holin family protein n=1 Tax=Caenispirillum salinarum AK4 TaxID=1238182 RepID=K9GUH4_9PROT|nr:phage holin family protein [Caenispirillum salinarum]EKV28404.1 hypothetical protein C882_0978 [Caenispirillum salinarum AK4]
MIARLMAVLALKERAKVAMENAAEAAVAVAIRIAIKLVAAIFLLIGFIYATLALYLYLVTVMEPWQAMGIVAGGILVIGVVIFLLGSGGAKGETAGEAAPREPRGGRPAAPPPRTRRPPGEPLEADPMAAMAARGGEVGVALHERLRRNPELAAAAALGAGLLIGRSPGARKALLALVSAALGAKAGND